MCILGKFETIEGPEYRFIRSVRQRSDFEVTEFFEQFALPHGTNTTRKRVVYDER